MRKTVRRVSIMFFLFIYSLQVFSQEVSLIPKVVYVGDDAEVRFGFKWDGNLLSDIGLSFVDMMISDSNDASLAGDYTIKSMQLLPSQDGYVLSVLFVPWKAGYIDMEPFDLSTIFSLEINSLLIDIPEIYIESIFDNSTTTEINPPVGPVIIPGTTYVLIAIILFLLLFCIFVIIIIARLGLISSWLKSFFGKIWASNNFKKASRELIVLSKQSESIDPKVFAARLSLIIRTYLEGRFSHRFTAETTSSFFAIFDELFAGTVSARAGDFLQNLYEICVRCDFLHYAGTETTKAPLTPNEQESLINKTRLAIVYFEKDSDDEKEGGGS